MTGARLIDGQSVGLHRVERLADSWAWAPPAVRALRWHGLTITSAAAATLGFVWPAAAAAVVGGIVAGGAAPTAPPGSAAAFLLRRRRRPVDIEDAAELDRVAHGAPVRLRATVATEGSLHGLLTPIATVFRSITLFDKRHRYRRRSDSLSMAFDEAERFTVRASEEILVDVSNARLLGLLKRQTPRTLLSASVEKIRAEARQEPLEIEADRFTGYEQLLVEGQELELLGYRCDVLSAGAETTARSAPTRPAVGAAGSEPLVIIAGRKPSS